MNKKCFILGVPINIVSLRSLTSYLIKSSKSSKRLYICLVNVHMIVTSKKNILLKKAMNSASFLISDGMPLVWEMKRKGYKDMKRISGTELLIELCAEAEKKELSVFFYGGSQSTIVKLKKNLNDRFEKLKIVGMESPPPLPIMPIIDNNVIERINRNKPAFVFIGLGCPKQELWMQAYSPHIKSTLLGVGAAFDFISGNSLRAPIWMQKSGLEWAHRLYNNPKRLWKRYLVTNTLFICYWLLERIMRK